VLCVVVPLGVHASPPSIIASQVQGMTDSARAHVSNAGLHLLVRMNGRAYDAYTGAAGLPWADYMSRLGAVTPIVEKVVESP
jgi:hypothetical protein